MAIDRSAKTQGWIRLGVSGGIILCGVVASHVRMEVIQSQDRKFQNEVDKSQDLAIKRIDELGSRQLNDYSFTLKTVENDVRHLTASFNEFKKDTKAWQERVEGFLYNTNKPKLE